MKVSFQQFLVLLIAIIAFTSCQQKETATRYVIGDDVSYLLLGSESTKDELQDIAADFMDLQDIEVDFSGTLYDTDGKIINLNLKVTTENGGGSVSSSSSFSSPSSAGFIVSDNSFKISSNLKLDL